MAKRILGYLKKHNEQRIVFNPNPLNTAELLRTYCEHDTWRELYPDAVEENPPDQPPTLLGTKKAQVTIFVDADHAHCEVTRRLVMGIIVFVNFTPVKWYSKMRGTADFAVELRYKLRMLGFDPDGPTTILGDNNAVVLNTTIPSSQLKKKQLACAYHRVREMIAYRATRFVHIASPLNCSDVSFS